MSDPSEFKLRQQHTFEQAEGAEAVPGQLALKELSPRLRASLWAIIYENFIRYTHREDFGQLRIGKPWVTILREEHVHRDFKPADEFSTLASDHIARIKQKILEGDYLTVLGWLQWVLRNGGSNIYAFTDRIRESLSGSGAAYRLLDDNKTLAPLSSDAELATIKKAIVDLKAKEFGGARAHLTQAAQNLTDGKISDSIRESIHAVESVVRVLEPQGDFAKALSKLETKVKIHGALKSGFSAIYGFTSDEKGIRHPLLDKDAANVDETDALFMIGACASFVSYLTNKARAAGLLK